jgi:glycosyltransferase involved in cell wall biosynthesis
VRERPKISVVTISYNDAVGMKRTIDSIKVQSYRNFEHQIVDGGSGDGTAEIAAEYARSDSRVTFSSEADSGIFDAMNKGARRASGDLVVFLNSGDVLTDSDVLEFVAHQWAVEPEWKWGYGAQRHLNSQLVPSRGSIISPFNVRKFELGLQFVPHPSSYVDRNLFLKAGGFDESFGTAADQEFFFRIVRRHKPAVWIRFVCDFLDGGIHTTETAWSRERLWHKMRVKNGVAILGSPSIDAATSWLIALARAIRSWLGRRSGQSESKITQR